LPSINERVDQDGVLKNEELIMGIWKNEELIMGIWKNEDLMGMDE